MDLLGEIGNEQKSYLKMLLEFQEFDVSNIIDSINIADSIFQIENNRLKIRQEVYKLVGEKISKNEDTYNYYSLLFMSIHIIKNLFQPRTINNMSAEELLVKLSLDELISLYKNDEKEELKKYLKTGDIYTIIKTGADIISIEIMINDLFEAVKKISINQHNIKFPINDVRNFGRLLSGESIEVLKKYRYSISKKRISRGSKLTIKYLCK